MGKGTYELCGFVGCFLIAIWVGAAGMTLLPKWFGPFEFPVGMALFLTWVVFLAACMFFGIALGDMVYERRKA